MDKRPATTNHRRAALLLPLALCVCLFAGASVQAAPLPGERQNWKGFDKHSFEVDGRPCYVVAPRDAAPGKPWVWRARFPGFHAEADLILLERGLHIAPSKIQESNGFEVIAKCDPRANGGGGRIRPGYFDVPMLVGDQTGDTFSHTFTGRSIGLVAVAGADAGVIEFRIDVGDWQTLDLMTPHPGVHLPRLYMLADELTTDDQHTLTVKLTDTRKGGVCRLTNLAVNGE